MGRIRGLLWLVAGLFLAAIAGLLAFQGMSRATTMETVSGLGTAGGPVVEVVLAARAVPIRTQLSVADLRTVTLPADAMASDAVTSITDAVGKLTTAELFEGEVLLAHRLLDPTVVSPDGRMALLMVEDEVLMAIPGDQLLTRARLLKPGDHVDVLTSMWFSVKSAGGDGMDEETLTTFAVLQNVPIAGLVGSSISPPRSDGLGDALDTEALSSLPDAVLLTLTPQDALTLKYVVDAGAMLDLMLRAPGVDRPFETNAIDADYLDKRYNLPLDPGR
jgi:pilus assembly protein CpaB